MKTNQSALTYSSKKPCLCFTQLKYLHNLRQ